MQTKISRTAFLCLTLAAFLVPGAVAQDAPAKRHVLYVNSYDQRMDWSRRLLDGIYEVLDPDANNLVIHIENLDTKRHPLTEEYEKTLLASFKQKYRHLEFACILSSDNNAYTFLGNNYFEIFGEGADVPVFHCGVNGFMGTNDAPPNPNFYGIAEHSFPAKTFEEAANLFPPLRRGTLYVINDHLATGDAWHNRCEIELDSLRGAVDVIHLRNDSKIQSMSDLEQFLRTVDNRDGDKVVILGVFYQDRAGDYFSYERQTRIISTAAIGNEHPIPVFGLLDFHIGEGVVGGWVIGGYKYGKSMAELGKRYLDSGKLPEEHLEYPTPSRHADLVFSYPAASQFGLSEDVLLARTDDVRKLPPSRNALVATIIFGVVSGIALIVLSYWLIDKLRRIVIEYTNLYQSPIAALFQTTADGERFLRMSPRTAELLGYESVGEAIAKARPIDTYADANSRRQLISSLRNGSVGAFTTQLVDAKGVLRTIRMSAVLYPKRKYIEGFVEEIDETTNTAMEMSDKNLHTTYVNQFPERTVSETLSSNLTVVWVAFGTIILLILGLAGLQQWFDSALVSKAVSLATPLIVILLIFISALTLPAKLRTEVINTAIRKQKGDSTKGEQGGADQPATAVQSEPE